MTAPQRIADVHLDPDHKSRIWAGVKTARSRRRRRRRQAAWVGSVAVLGSLLWLLSSKQLGETTQRIARTTRATEPTSSVVLLDGSQVQLETGAEMQLVQNLPEGVELVLSEGVARFDVTHRPRRRFVVRLPSATLHVVGTRFVVSVSSDEQRLIVTEGTVEVRDPDGALLGRVDAGGSWSGRIDRRPDRPAGERPAPASEPEPAGRATESAESRPSDEQDSPPSAAATPLPESAATRTSSPAGTATEHGSTPPPASVTPEPNRAERLFDAAMRARRQGRTDEAIAGYEKLLRLYPEDRHASLAAFELGRLKRQRNDPEGAAQALKRAVGAPGDSPLGEDALAQLVLSYDDASKLAECRAAQKRYLDRFPNGVHTSEVRRRCQKP